VSYNFRLEWDNEEKLSDVLLLLKELVKCSSHLERVALCYFKYQSQIEWIAPPDFEDRVLSFALESNDPTIPRIHYDGIVNPIDWFYASPSSL